MESTDEEGDDSEATGWERSVESTHEEGDDSEATGWERSVESTHEEGDDSEATGWERSVESTHEEGQERTSMSELWGVGSYVDGAGTRASWEISQDEIDRDIGVATEVLGALGVGGDGVLWCSMLSEAGQIWPYVCGTVLAGGRLSCADATQGEAARVAMFLRRMSYGAVFGVTPAILDGLEALDHDPAELFGRVRLVAACAGAFERLRCAGLSPVRFALCGPAVAIGRKPDGPAFVAPDEWDLDQVDGRIVVTARRPRAQAFVRTQVGVCGRIAEGGVTW